MHRRVVLLDTDERAGLVAELTDACRRKGVSLEISTGPGHVLLSFEADDETTEATCEGLRAVHGVEDVRAYAVVTG